MEDELEGLVGNWFTDLVKNTKCGACKTSISALDFTANGFLGKTMTSMVYNFACPMVIDKFSNYKICSELYTNVYQK